MAELVTAKHLQILADADTPEEAAQRFLAAVSRGLAGVVAEKLDEILTAAVVSTNAAPQIKGWNNLISSCVIDLCWERPSIGSPVGQVVGYSARKTNGVAALGVEFSAGISIKATF